MPTINANRLIDDLKKLRSFGAQGDGVVRTAFSTTDLESRTWLQQRFDEAGLRAEIDAIGNVFGFSPCSGPAVLIGSHSDTQPQGGWLDGAYGVICALEVARAFAECSNTRNYAIDIASWMDEEGTFLGSLGSLVYCQLLSEEEFKPISDVEGRSLVDVLQSTGVAKNPRRYVDTQRQFAYLEAHIEQGPVLDSAGQAIGVVTGIVGVRDCTFCFTGQQNHAGTTPMHLRKDAVTALVKVASKIQECFPAVAHTNTVWTIGTITLPTQAPSIVPGYAEMTLQIRDIDGELLDTLEQLASEIAAQNSDAKGVSVEFKVKDRAKSAAMDQAVQDSIATAAEQHAAGRWRYMPSGAAHDAQVLAERLPAGMVFVPSLGGISHSFEEETEIEDLVLGCQVLCDAAYNLFQGNSHESL